MKYILLVYGNENALTENEREECGRESAELANKIHATGQYLAASPLEPTTTSRSVRVRDGKRIVTDGPFAETREQLGGFFLIEARDLDEALTIAAQVPMARRGTIEVRALRDLPGLPELGR